VVLSCHSKLSSEPVNICNPDSSSNLAVKVSASTQSILKSSSQSKSSSSKIVQSKSFSTSRLSGKSEIFSFLAISQAEKVSVKASKAESVANFFIEFFYFNFVILGADLKIQSRQKRNY
jgi:hypothetical protein